MSENNEPTSLHEQLAQATEQKAPQSTTAPTWFASDEEIQQPNPAGTTEAEKTQTEQTQTEAPKNTTGKLPEEIIRASAETAVLMFDQVLTLGCSLRINSKFDNKFTQAEKEKLAADNLIDTPEEQLANDADKILLAKWKRLTKQKTRSLDAIPLSPEEEKRHTDAWHNYLKIKNKAIPPEYLLFGNMLLTLIDRIAETEL